MPIAFMTRISRSNMVEQMKANYIMTAKAKGLGTVQIVGKHAFHNAVLPVLTVATMMVGTMNQELFW
jgi:ABC-type dipeptide/oligopeptide/nickel transport system permease component